MITQPSQQTLKHFDVSLYICIYLAFSLLIKSILELELVFNLHVLIFNLKFTNGFCFFFFFLCFCVNFKEYFESKNVYFFANLWTVKQQLTLEILKFFLHFSCSIFFLLLQQIFRNSLMLIAFRYVNTFI